MVLTIFSIGANLRESANVTLVRTVEGGQSEALSDISLATNRGQAHISVDTTSKSLLLHMRSGDTVKLVAHNSTFLYSDEHNLVSISGKSQQHFIVSMSAIYFL